MLTRLSVLAVAGSALVGPTAASAITTYTVDLIELNGSGVSGNVRFDIADDRSTLRARANITGLPTNPDGPNAHVNHIHGLFDDDGNAVNSRTPTLDPNADMDIFGLVQDANEDGIIQVFEGVPAYGDVLLSLEKPNATEEAFHQGPIDDDGDGTLIYDYTFDLTDELIFSTVTDGDYTVADLFPLETREYVIHGGFDGEVFSATLPVASGQIRLDETTTPVPLPAAGWLLVAGIAGLGAIRRRG